MSPSLTNPIVSRRIVFRPVDYIDDGDKIIEHLRDSFLRGSPSRKYSASVQEEESELFNIKNRYLPQNLSIVAIDEETNEVAGVRVVIAGPYNMELAKLEEQEGCYKILRMKQLLVKRASATITDYDDMNMERECSGLLVSVAPKYRGCGIAKELYILNNNFLRDQGFQVVKSFFSSPIARKMAFGLGYEELSRVYFEEMIGSDGIPEFANADEGTFMNHMAKKL